MPNDQDSRKIRRVGSLSAADSPKKQPTKKGKRRLSTAGRIVLFVLLALLLGGIAYGVKFYYDITHPATLFQEEPTPTPAPEATASPASVTSVASAGSITPLPTPTVDTEQQLLSQADLQFMKNRVNVLVMGIDESTERANWGSFRTDTMILVTIDFGTKNVDMISVPRDSYVKITDSKGNFVTRQDGTTKFDKINSAFSSGGGAQKSGYLYAMSTVSRLLGGIPIQYYFGFNMNVVKQVVDAMGGVDYNVDTEVKMNGRQLHPGMQHLDGQAVLDYARQRKGSSDIARVDRQQKIIMAIFQQMKTAGTIGQLPAIYQAVEQNIQTNLSFKQISSLALLALQMNPAQLNRHTVDGEFLNMNSLSYWGISTDKLVKLVKSVFGVSIKADTDIDVTNIKTQILAAQALVAPELKRAGAAIAAADNLLNNYASWLPDTTKNALTAAEKTVQDAMDAQDKTQLDAATPALENLCNAIIVQIQGYTGPVPQGTAAAPATPAPAQTAPAQVTPTPAG